MKRLLWVLSIVALTTVAFFTASRHFAVSSESHNGGGAVVVVVVVGNTVGVDTAKLTSRPVTKSRLARVSLVRMASTFAC